MRRKPNATEKTVHKFIYMAQNKISIEKKKFISHMKKTKQMSECGHIPLIEQESYYKGYMDGLNYCQKMLHGTNVEFSNVMKEHDAPIVKKKKVSKNSPKFKEIKFDIAMDFTFPTIEDGGSTIQYLLNNELTSTLLKDHTMRLVLSPYSYKEFPLRPVLTASTVYNTVRLDDSIGLIKEIDLQRCIIKVEVREEEVEKFFNGRLIASEWIAHMRVTNATYKQVVGELPVLNHGGKLFCFDLVRKDK